MNRHLRPARAMGALLLACAAILLAMWILRGAPPGFEAESQERQSLAHQVGAIVARDLDTAEPTRLRSDIEAWMAASEGVVSVGLRREDGRTLVEAGDVEYLRERWDRSSLTPDAVDIAILQGGERWGTLLVLFNPTLPGAANLGASGLTGWILVFALLLLPGAMLCVEILSRRRGLRAPGKDVVVASERARNTLDTLAEGVIVLDPRRRIVFANASARAILNEIRSDAPALEIDGLAWFDARTPNTPLDAPWARSAREDRTILGERLHLRIDERREFVFIVNATPIHAGKRLAGTLVTLDDVTDIEHSREKLREARDAAEAANQAKSSFLAMMSHEIRTPINGVSGTLELLQGTRLADRQRRYVEAARFSASTLLHIINDILDFSKIEAGQFELSPIDFDIEPCLDECMLMMSDHAFEKGLLLEYEIDDDVAESVHGDPARLRQILINLTKNAIKFTERGSVTITVAVEADGPNEQLLRFSVRDTGIGIPEDKQDRLFRAFSQVDSSMSRTAGGTGLGLAISR